MSSPPRPDHPDGHARRPVTLTKLAEMRALGEPIVMVTAYDHPSAAGRRGGRRRHRARRRQRGQQRARLLRHRPGDRRGAADARRAPCAAGCARRCWSATCRSAPTRRRTSRRSRPPTGSSRRRAATPSSSRAAALAERARAIVARRRAGDGPRRADAADGDRARRLPRPGPHGRARAGGARRGAGAPGGGLLLDRLRGDPGRRDRRDHAARWRSR